MEVPSLSESWFSLLYKGPHGLLMIRCLPSRDHPLGLTIHRGKEVERRRVVQVILDEAKCHLGSVRELSGRLERLLLKRLVGTDPVHEADFSHFVASMRSEKNISSRARADPTARVSSHPMP